MLRLLIMTALLGLAAAAADWPMHRGNPQLTGVAPGELGSRFALAWRFASGGPVKGGAAIVGNRLYVGSGDSHVYALEADSGKVIWDVTLGAAVEATPLVLGETVYLGAADNTFYALAADSGKERWRLSSEDKFLGAANYLPGPGGAMRILVGGYDTKLYCLDAETGKPVWTYATESYINGTPATADDLVAVGGCDSYLHLVNAADGTLANKVKVEAYVAGSAAVSGDRAYLGNYGNEVVAIDLNTSELVWKYTFRDFPFFASPAVTADRLVIGGRDKQVHCLATADGKPLWRFPTRRRVDSSPVIAGDKVVVGSEDGYLYVLRLADGQVVWKYLAGKAINSPPAVANGWIYVGCDDGGVYAFKPAEEGP